MSSAISHGTSTFIKHMIPAKQKTLDYCTSIFTPQNISDTIHDLFWSDLILSPKKRVMFSYLQMQLYIPNC